MRTGLFSASLVVCGAINALLSKVTYQLRAEDCSGVVRSFEKPWLSTALMFMAMSACLPIAWVQQRWYSAYAGSRARKTPQQADADVEASGGTAAAAAPAGAADDAATGLQQPLLAPSASDNHNSSSRSRRVSSRLHEALLLCVPTGFDLAATTLMNVGLLYVAASVFQVLRGSEMLFAAFYAVVFLHRPLNRWHFMGVALCTAGIGSVGASRMLAGSSGGLDQPAALAAAATPLPVDASGGADSKLALVGMGLILLSQAIQAAQVTVEDHLMSDMDMHPLLVVGWEGLIGSCVMLGGVLPLLQRLPYREGSAYAVFAEDTRGSWCMVKNSPAIAGTLAVSTFAVLLYNIFGMFVTEDLGAAARVVLENMRTAIVWLAALALYYTGIGSCTLGEPWDSWSWLQAVGFAVFAGGAFMYNKGHQQQEQQEEAAGKAPTYSKWAVLKSTLSISTGHRVAAGRRFRAAGNAVLAGLRAQRLTHDGSDVLHTISEAPES